MTVRTAVLGAVAAAGWALSGLASDAPSSPQPVPALRQGSGPTAAKPFDQAQGKPPEQMRRGLSSNFVETLVEGIPVGTRYVLASRPVDATNTGDYVMDVRFDAAVPQPVEMRAGYEPIPDAAWVSFEPRTFVLAPRQTATGKMVLYIPDDPSLVGKRFQVMLSLHGSPKESPTLGVGVMPRVMFSLRASGPGATPMVDHSPRYPKLGPYEIAGKEATLVVPCGSLWAENIFENGELTYEVAADPSALKHLEIRRDETPLPDHAWLELNPRAVVLAPMTKAEIQVTARVPFAAAHVGKTYAAGIHGVSVSKDGRRQDLWNKVRIEIPALGGK